MLVASSFGAGARPGVSVMRSFEGWRAEIDSLFGCRFCDVKIANFGVEDGGGKHPCHLTEVGGWVLSSERHSGCECTFETFV